MYCHFWEVHECFRVGKDEGQECYWRTDGTAEEGDEELGVG